MLKRLAAALLLRRLAHALDRLAVSQERQLLLLERLVNHLAPAVPAADRATLTARTDDTGVSHFDALEAGLAIDFVERTRAATGHVPDDDEILIHLADENTKDLAQRLSARDEELTRLMEARR